MAATFGCAAGVAAGPPTFEEHVRPIFREKCGSCHNPDRRQGGLDLTAHARVLAGGSSGAVIAPGDPDGSYLFQLVSHASEPTMPPESDPIPSAMLETIRAWIAGGAIERAGGEPLAAARPATPVLEVAEAAPAGPPVMPPRLPLAVVGTATRPLAITALAASPNGGLVAVGGRRQVLLYDAATLEFLGVLPFPEGDVKSLRFSRNARLLVAGGGRGAVSGRVVAWDVAGAKRVAEVGEEFDQVLAVDLSADQRLAVLGGPQKVVRLLRTVDGGVEAELRKHTDWITAAEFAPDGRLLATGDRAGNAFLWEVRGGREAAVLKGHGGGITAVAWRADGAVLATASEDGKIRLWNPRGGERTKEWVAHAGGTLGLWWLPDGRLASCGRDKKAVLWKADGSKQREFPALADAVVRVAVTSDGGRLFAGDVGGTLAAFDLADGREAGVVDTNPPSLERRLEVAEATLGELAAAGEAAEERARAATAALEELQSQLEAARRAADEATAEREAARARQAEAAEAVERWRAEIGFAGQDSPR